MKLWQCWTLAPDRHVLELELHVGAGYAPSFDVWRLSKTGAVLAIVRAEEA